MGGLKEKTRVAELVSLIKAAFSPVVAVRQALCDWVVGLMFVTMTWWDLTLQVLRLAVSFLQVTVKDPCIYTCLC